MSKIVVAIPAYNCEPQIGKVISGLSNTLLDRIYKVIVIDNRSTDNTLLAAKLAAKKHGSTKIEVWQNQNNYNLGGSHKVAFLTAEKLNADYIAIIHGDNQGKSDELHDLIDSAERDPRLGAILGCRFMKGSRLMGYDSKRIWGNKIINLAYSVVCLRSSLDLGSGLNLFKVSELNDHRYLGFGDTMTFNIDLLLDYYRKKTPLKFIPITWREEDQISNARNFQIGTTALKKLSLWRLGYEKNTWLNKKPSDYISKKV